MSTDHLCHVTRSWLLKIHTGRGHRTRKVSAAQGRPRYPAWRTPRWSWSGAHRPLASPHFLSLKGGLQPQRSHTPGTLNQGQRPRSRTWGNIRIAQKPRKKMLQPRPRLIAPQGREARLTSGFFSFKNPPGAWDAGQTWKPLG